MADTKISALTDGTTAEASDRIPAVRDPTGTPVNRWISPGYIRTYMIGTANTWTALQTFSSAITGASNVLDMRNGTNAQSFRVFQTYTDASNYSALEVAYSGGRFVIQQAKLGTGSSQDILISSNGNLILGGAGGTQWLVNGGGHFLANTDATYDMGSSGANRPRVGYASSGWLVTGTGTGGVGYGTGSGGAVTQETSRTTGVTLNKLTGAITLVSAAGSTTAATFTVTNSTVAATDTIVLSQKSGTDRYDMIVSAVAAGSFDITFRTYSGTTTEQPVFNFAVLKAVAS